eukprot:GFYU01008802.1.p1 GENE.GFYU01008802.1~~GFYU01008802.1.p1  ORF type:complete len:518 (-),score=159.24 GFYU01008802.1:27-1580(-)
MKSELSSVDTFSATAWKDSDSLPRQMLDAVLEYLSSQDDRELPVVKFSAPSDVTEAFQKAGVPLSLEQQKACSADEVLKALSTVIDYSVKTSHARFHNQLFASVDPVAIVGDWLTTALNTSMYTFEVAPVFTLMEQQVLTKIASLIGPGYGPDHDGLFAPGGTISNLYAMEMARNKAYPDARLNGMYNCKPLIAFTSAHSHYSIDKAMNLLGLGTNNLVKVPCNEQGQMLTHKLEEAVKRAIDNGGLPFFVNGTAGTTVVGAYDPFHAIADICEKYNMWFHVDGCWGASLLLSNTERHVMDGVDRSDSLSWNPHKMMGIPLQCCALVTRHRGELEKCNAFRAAYLFQKDKANANVDTGDKTIQCGRHVDVLKLWLTWKYVGDAGWTRAIDHAKALTTYMADKIRNDASGRFVLATQPSCTNLCFWYVPPSMSDLVPRLTSADASALSEEERGRLHRVAPIIKERMQKKGVNMIGFQPVNGGPNCFRMIVVSPKLSAGDIDELLVSLDSCGNDIPATA